MPTMGVSSIRRWRHDRTGEQHRNIRLATRIAFTNYDSAARVWAGVTDQLAAVQMAANDNPAGNRAMFLGGITDANWQAVTKDGTTQTKTDTGVARTASAFNTLEIKFNDDIPNVVFSIDGVVVATHTTNLPTDGTNLRCIVGAFRSAGAARIWIQYIYIEQNQIPVF